MTSPVQGRICHFVRCLSLEDIPREIVDTALSCLTDTVAAMLSGAGSPQYKAVFDGLSLRALGVEMAAPSLFDQVLLGGVCAHSQEYNDLFYCQPGHPSACLVPVALGLGNRLGSSGRQVLEAYMAGFEVTALVNQAMLPQGHIKGFHTTGVAGTLGCAMAAGKLLGLSERQLRQALSLGCTFACSLRANFGTTANSLHVGMAGANGLRAAVFAKSGVDAKEDLLSNDFAACYLLDTEKLEALSASLGRVWAFREPGVLLKKFPCCFSTYQAVEAALELRWEHEFNTEQIEHISILSSENHCMSLPRHWPDSEYSQRFCMPYCVSAALIFSRLDPDCFGQGFHERADFLRLKGRTSCGVDPDQKRMPGFGYSVVRLRLSDGRELSATAKPKPSDRAENWGETRLWHKFSLCTQSRLTPKQSHTLFRVLLQADQWENISPLCSLIVGNDFKERKTI